MEETTYVTILVFFKKTLLLSVFRKKIPLSSITVGKTKELSIQRERWVVDCARQVLDLKKKYRNG